jgi:hypothetical protein
MKSRNSNLHIKILKAKVFTLFCQVDRVRVWFIPLMMPGLSILGTFIPSSLSVSAILDISLVTHVGNIIDI